MAQRGTAAMKKRDGKATVPGSDSGRRFRFGLWIAALLALLWRLAVSGEIASGRFAGSIFQPSPATDLRTYMDLSRSIVEGTFSGPFYYQPFYYAFFLPCCRILGGGSVWMVIGVQALLGALTAVLAGLTAARLAGRRAGITAALLTAFLTPLVFYTPFHKLENLQSFNLMLLAFLAVLAVRRRRVGYDLALGAVAGVAVLTRGNMLLLALPLFLFLGATEWRRSSWRHAVMCFAVMVLTMLAVEAPFMIYNSMQLGRLSGPSTAADAVLALGNTPEAPPGGRNPGLPAGPMEYPAAYHEWMATAAERPVIGRVFEWLRAEPAAFFELTFRKLLLFWDYREIPNNVALAGEGTTSRLLRFTVPGGVVLALGVAGMLLLAASSWRRRNAAWGALYLIVFCFWGGTAAFYNLERFRTPLLPVLAVFAGAFVAVVWRRYRRKDWRYLRTAGVLALGVGIFLVFGAYEFYRTRLEAAVMRLARPAGTRLLLNDGRTAVFNYGPMTFGGWELLDTDVGASFQTAFEPPVGKPGAEEWQVELNVQSERAGILDLTVNGRPCRIEFTGPEYKSATFKVPPSPTGMELNMKVTVNTAKAALIADFQRDYGRTRMDGRPLPAELVVRLTR